MREVARLASGYYATQDRVTQMVAAMLHWPASGMVTIADAQAGNADAILPLTLDAKRRSPHVAVHPFGCEADKGRAEHANALCQQHGGFVLWANTEDCTVNHRCSLLVFNPPYDGVRGFGRLEEQLFEPSLEWLVRGGIGVFILQKKFWEDNYRFQREATRLFDILGKWDYPIPEREQFGQSVVIGRRRMQDKTYNDRIDTGWVDTPWPCLDEWHGIPFNVPAVPQVPTVYRKQLSPAHVMQLAASSPIRAALLRDAMKPPPEPERPLLPMRAGHMALALAGGLCDGAFVDDDGNPFLLKGTLTQRTADVKQEDKFDDNGRLTGKLVTMKTRYDLIVRAIRHTGTIEEYKSHASDNSDHASEDDADANDDCDHPVSSPAQCAA